MGLVVWLAAVEAITQSPGSTPVFRHLTIDDGLSQNVVAALLQDRHGFVWVGTKDGLYRFDGLALVVHRHDPFDPATLSSSHVTALLEGDAGHLWVGTRDGGLNRLSQITGEMVRYTHSPAGPIAALVDDGNGRLWGATLGGGLFHLRQEDGHDPDAVFERVVNEQAGVDSLRINFVKALLRDDRGTMWAGSSAGLHRYDAATERGDLLTELPVSALAQARDGTVWVGQRVGLRAQLVRVDGGVDPAPGRLRVTAFDYPDLPMNPGWEQIDDSDLGVSFHPECGTTVLSVNFAKIGGGPKDLNQSLLIALEQEVVGSLIGDGYVARLYLFGNPSPQESRQDTAREGGDMFGEWESSSAFRYNVEADEIVVRSAATSGSWASGVSFEFTALDLTPEGIEIIGATVTAGMRATTPISSSPPTASASTPARAGATRPRSISR